jgi:hypothetical protein
MRSELLVMIRHLQRMRRDFQVMATNVDGTADQVEAIQTCVASLPHIAAGMTATNADAWRWRTAIGGMTDRARAMSADVAMLGDTNGEMGYHFRSVQLSVDYMNHNVGQMLRPLSILPR